ncbi:helix-turn-helix transcriptional regulator [Paractinoplanes atraurantiacus]|uniref:Regulatory protein, luxR family n=1 Tax=Paractinoplanes atraurantiacus TaxID=1036182 RepID=A0A285J3Y5_9ACTN|nr:LuxR family transcriptional regulator [Actinoplanes atraurantiacus]SNY54567.1 regulatory protein, luxR family [Actinoplanes atraurantiacus]
MEPDTPVRGRDRELGALQHALGRVVGGQGSVTLVTGPAGSGKSRLLREAALAAGLKGVRRVAIAADPDSALIPGDSLMRGLLGGADPILGSERMRELVAEPERRYWVLAEVQDAIESAALRQPLLITVDDLQWCDDLTLLAMRALPERLSADAVMWLFAGRRADGPPGYLSTLGRLTDGGAETLDLDRLDDDAAAAMTADLLGATPSPDLLAAVHGTGNRPMLISALVRGAREDGPPVRLRALIRRQLSRLGEDARTVLEVASVLSRLLSLPLIAELMHRPPAALLAPVREAHDFLREDDDGHLVFQHDLIREAVRATVPGALARTLRRQAARVAVRENAPAVEVASLLSDSAEPGDAEAIAALRLAAAELAPVAPSSAADVSRRALELTPAGSPLRGEIIAEGVRLLWLAGRAHEATKLGHSLLSESLDPGTEAAIRLGIAAVSSQYSFAEAVRQCERAVALPGLPITLRASLLALEAVNLTLVGDMPRAESVLEEGMDAAIRAGDDGARAICVASQSVNAFYEQRWGAAFDLADEAVEFSARVGADAALWGSTQWRGWLDTVAGRPDLALEHAERGMKAAQRDGQAWLLRQWSMDRCSILYKAGRLSDARAEAEGVRAMSDELGAGNYADVTALMTVGRVALHTGDLAAARRYDAEAERMRADEAPLVRHSGLWLGALVAVALGREPAHLRALLAEAAECLGDRIPPLGTPLDPADEVLFIRIARDIGETSWADRAVAALERRAAANPSFRFLAATAAHARGDMTEAVALYRSFPRPLPLAVALEDVGTVEALEEACLIYDEAGATHDSSRVRAALRKLGVRRRPRAAARPGWSALTATEQDVARRVADGATNRQVAAAMFLSPHTVSTHLRHAFTKLGINSRVELARLVHQHSDL